MANSVASGRVPGVVTERALARATAVDPPEYLTAEEAHALIGAVTSPRDRILLATLWATGGRVSEVLALRRCDFDAIGRTLRLPNLKQRRGARKVVYVPSSFALELLSYCDATGRRGDALLFPSRRGGALSRIQAWRIVHAAATRAGVVKAGGRLAWCHLFRHGHAIHALRHGVPLPMLQDQLGHASILTTRIYTRLSADDKRRTIEGVTL